MMAEDVCVTYTELSIYLKIYLMYVNMYMFQKEYIILGTNNGSDTIMNTLNMTSHKDMIYHVQKQFA